jgi:hypothetical protein
MFENRVLRRTFGPKREEMAGGWRRLHNEELHNLYASPTIIRVIKSRRIRQERCEMHTVFWLGNLKGRGHLEDPGIDGYNIRNKVERCGMDSSSSG